ncbi:MAG: putative endonuclease [Parvicellaceae bacterium]|jgi:putative endonuclease
MRIFFVYITTNKNENVIYVGVTSDLVKRLKSHQAGDSNFTGKYNCYHLIYYECSKNIVNAIAREKQIKRWSRAKKEFLIKTRNPTRQVLRLDVLETYSVQDFKDHRGMTADG